MARPAIVGTVIRRIDLNHTSAGKNKDYRITVAHQDDSGMFRVYTEHGPAGRLRNGRELTAAPVDAPTTSAAARPRKAASAWNLCASSRAHLSTLF